MAVIIGAGPAGLYAAIKLKKAGVNHVVVYDPRADNYTRPGYLGDITFKKAEAGIEKNFWFEEGVHKTGHIKDYERKLYEEAIQLGIKIEQKSFVRFHEDENAPGVVITDGTKTETVIDDYVFDCTGSKRVLVEEVNRIDPDSPMQITEFVKLPVSHHFLAYVKTSSSDWQKFLEVESISCKSGDPGTASSFAENIMKLRGLGWKELKYPRLYATDFGKGKACFYIHAPDSLRREDHDLWVQTVLQSYAPGMRYERLMSEKPKPRFEYFQRSAKALKHVAHKAKRLPTVIALGDAQIEADYFLAHGILDGMKRTDALLQHIKIVKGEIKSIDGDAYFNGMSRIFNGHKQAVIDAAVTLEKSFAKGLSSAQIKLRKVLKDCTNDGDRAEIQKILKEIEIPYSFS